MRLAAIISGWLVGMLVLPAAGQSSSMLRATAPQASGARLSGTGSAAGVTGGSTETEPGVSSFAAMLPKDESKASTRAIEAVSVVAIPRMPPRKFKVEDFITIIVRQQKKYEANAKFDREKKWDLEGKLSDWFRLYRKEHTLGSDKLPMGQPGYKFNMDDKYETNGQNDRQDSFITRIQATVIDVKPNGNLVLEATQREEHDEEKIDITLTGMCRSEDVTAENSVLSTQLARLVLIEKNVGAVRDSTQRGWVPRILDWAKPF